MTPARLPLGAVVVDGLGERGQVVYDGARGWVSGVTFANDYSIRLSLGHYRCGTDVDAWTLLSVEEWTTEERVRSASLLYEPPSWPEPAENDSYAFAVIAALLPPAERERVFPEDGDWPTSIEDLVEHVAVWLDHALPARETLGRALARIES